jgi:hypothetical protein
MGGAGIGRIRCEVRLQCPTLASMICCNMKQYQSPKPIPRTNDNTERIAIRLPPDLKRKFLKRGSEWLRQLIREN